MDSNLYDEFGNYIGGDLGEEEDVEEWDEGCDTFGYGTTSYDDAGAGFEEAIDADEMTTSGLSTLEAQESVARAVVDYDPNNRSVVLAEDKQYYRSSEEIYGEDVEVIVQDEDTQPLDKPIIEPIRERKFLISESRIPETSFSMRFLAGLMDHPKFTRHIAVVGYLHHGKTSLIDLLVNATHNRKRSNANSTKFASSLDAIGAAEQRAQFRKDRAELLRMRGLTNNKARKVSDRTILLIIS